MLTRILGAALAVVASAGSALGQTPCDRACLNILLNQYLNAVITHKPAEAPLSIGFRQTENAVRT
jgi:hypothetical protein